MKSFTTFGVKEQHQSLTALDLHVENIKSRGYTILENVVSSSTLATLRNSLDEIYSVQCEDIGGEEQLVAIADSNTVRAPLVNDDLFLHDVAASIKVIEVVRAILGDFFVLMLQNGVINQPARDSEPNSYAHHRDLNYQHFVCSRPLALSALFCIDRFTTETGGTCVVPYSQKAEVCPSDAYILENEVVISAEAGSVIVFDSMMYHRSGVNVSENPRRAVNNMYVAGFIKQQISLPKMLDGKFSDDPFLAMLLGYTSDIDDSVTTFRQRRLARLRR